MEKEFRPFSWDRVLDERWKDVFGETGRHITVIVKATSVNIFEGTKLIQSIKMNMDTGDITLHSVSRVTTLGYFRGIEDSVNYLTHMRSKRHESRRKRHQKND